MGNIELVRRMLKSPNFNINAKDINGRTPLRIVAKEGFTIELLIKSSATVDVLGYEKRTALHEAALNAKYQAVEILLKYGAQVDSKGWGEDITRFGHNDKGTLYNTHIIHPYLMCWIYVLPNIKIHMMQTLTTYLIQTLK
ncbi:ankyrin repeat domain-containing protein [Candidatus Tisiphia endosymbiont of Parasteatoda lunata]|uniref:ankyrin repeat domain-containing protein n=1 Tax=Candidatus Tisiphia endosymbiont of Parasteatoda lunata TaxID=3066275 RepID=UPI00313C0DA0